MRESLVAELGVVLFRVSDLFIDSLLDSLMLLLLLLLLDLVKLLFNDSLLESLCVLIFGIDVDEEEDERFN